MRTRGRATSTLRPPRVTDPSSLPCRTWVRCGLCLGSHQLIPHLQADRDRGSHHPLTQQRCEPDDVAVDPLTQLRGQANQSIARPGPGRLSHQAQ